MGAEQFGEGDLALGGKESSGGVTEAAKEVFRENLKKSQAATKQIRTEEGKKQTYNNALAQLVSWMLKQGGYDFIVLLIADLVEANIPSDLILAVLSLEFTEAYDRAHNTVLSISASSDTKAMVQQTAMTGTGIFSEKIQGFIATWGERVIFNAMKEPEEVLETIIHVDTWKIHPSLVSKLLLL